MSLCGIINPFSITEPFIPQKNLCFHAGKKAMSLGCLWDSVKWECCVLIGGTDLWHSTLLLTHHMQLQLLFIRTNSTSFVL